MEKCQSPRQQKSRQLLCQLLRRTTEEPGVQMNVKERSAKIPQPQRTGATAVVVVGVVLALVLYCIGAEFFSRLIYYGLGIGALIVGMYFLPAKQIGHTPVFLET